MRMACQAKLPSPVAAPPSRIVCGCRMSCMFQQNQVRRKNRFTWRCLASFATAPAPAMQTAAIQVHFSIPYRVNFGQAMAIVGSADELGAWIEDDRVSHRMCCEYLGHQTDNPAQG